MCLAVPGEILEITDEDPIMRIGNVSFGGVVKEINLAYVPEAAIGDYVIVHVGFAISVLDEEEAMQTLQYLTEINTIAEELENNTDETH
jgi:hydrogenase expression/formation protein HypC